MVDRYWRKIEDVENNIENAMQISSILLKLKGYDKKFEGLSKIDTNERNISSNSAQMSTNEGNISSNTGRISTNESNISSNSEQISTNEGNISSNSGQISTNEENISSNLGKINTNKSNISEINSNLSNIDFNSGNKYSIENFFIYNIGIENNYKIDKDKLNFSTFKYTLEDDFKKDSILEIDCRLLYRYIRYNDIGFLQHIFKLYDDTDNMFYDYKSLKTNAG